MLTLYELAPTRSTRCRWTLKELDVEYESAGGREAFGDPEYKKIHPMGKFPALDAEGKILIESAAICTYLADRHAEKGLIAKPGTWDRALHDQWVSFALTEMEAWVWSSFRHTSIMPEAERVPAILEPNGKEYRKGASVLNDALADADYLISGAFSVTDIIVSYTVNWGRRMKLNDGFDHLGRYLERMFARPACTLNKE